MRANPEDEARPNGIGGKGNRVRVFDKCKQSREIERESIKQTGRIKAIAASVSLSRSPHSGDLSRDRQSTWTPARWALALDSRERDRLDKTERPGRRFRQRTMEGF